MQGGLKPNHQVYRTQGGIDLQRQEHALWLETAHSQNQCPGVTPKARAVDVNTHCTETWLE